MHILEKMSIFAKEIKKKIENEREIEYRLISETGPAHNKTFECCVVLDGIVYGVGEGKTKKAAEQEAAKKALEILAGK